MDAEALGAIDKKNLPASSSVTRCSSKGALEQHSRWRQDHTNLGVIYARSGHQCSLWSKARIGLLMEIRLMLRSDDMTFTIDIVDASYSVESLQYWENFAWSHEPANVEGLQVWGANGDWLFLTEQIANLVRYPLATSPTNRRARRSGCRRLPDISA